MHETAVGAHPLKVQIKASAQFSPAGFLCGPYEKELIKALLYDYERQNRPVLNESEPLVLTFGITLQQIIDVVNLFPLLSLWL